MPASTRGLNEAMTASESRAVVTPLRERVINRRDTLLEQVEEARELIELLDKNPDMKRVLELIAKTGTLY